MKGDEAFASFRQKLAARGFQPTRRRGQNFLVDPNLCDAIVASVAGIEDAIVLEIGSGLGFLTRRLAARARVVAVEIEPALVDILRQEMAETWGDEQRNVHLVAGDVLLDGALAPPCVEALAAHGARERGYLVVSNLPYSVAGPCLAALVQASLPPRDGVVLAQWEMARRILAAPRSREYGTLSVLCALAYAPRLLRKVPPTVFRPRPRVESALVRLGRAREWLRRPADQRRAFGAFLQGVFGGRRKVLANALRRVWEEEPGERFERAGLPLDWLRRRAGELAPEELWRVYGG